MSDAFITEAVAELAAPLIACRRDLHRHPEAAWTEYRTSALVAAELLRLGYRVRMGAEAVHPAHISGLPSAEVLESVRRRAVEHGADPALVTRMGDGLTGLVADLNLEAPGPCLALRFDMDCNQLREANDTDHRPNREGFASIFPGNMHACGHDGHTALGLAVAELCARHQDRLPCRLRLIFQPAEEGGRGARAMLAAGCVEGVDTLLGLHLGIQADHRHIVICGTHSLLATSKINVSINGISAHAANSPEVGRNALLAACAIIQNLHAIPPHSAGMTRINVGRIEGGDARNIIPDLCRFEMETRGETTELDIYMREAAARVIEGGAAMWGCTADIEYTGSLDGAHSDPALARRIAAAAAHMSCYTDLRETGPFKASEDFATLMLAVQANGGLTAFIQAGIDRTAPHHSKRFDFEETGLVQALELLVRVIFMR